MRTGQAWRKLEARWGQDGHCPSHGKNTPLRKTQPADPLDDSMGSNGAVSLLDRSLKVAVINTPNRTAAGQSCPPRAMSTCCHVSTIAA